ncbi:AAA family ATPase [Desulfosediminicola ganghwensis]|uniref:AAA family ATPase n=1 Tax=Desulfosediminicola ganghwensis TaxID=2569540 RepID=UPI0010ACCFB4|nr:AAA family ATPase [Desulfosediminicola ganghwensis]
MAKDFEDLKKWVLSLDVQDVFDLSKNQGLSGKSKNIAYNSAKRLQSGNVPSYKQIKALHRICAGLHSKSLAERNSHDGDLAAHAHTEAPDIDIKHLCLRMAWHDNRWNGTICKEAAKNDYCVGEYSLLSDRIRRRRDLEIETQPGCAGCKADTSELGQYQPPCFWSINAFGPEPLTFKHDNPVAADFPFIDESLPPYSVISWPFKLSFVKNEEEKKKYAGNYYPKKIFENRIRLFQRNVRPAESVVFTYCNYSNPVSGEEMKYLVTGCALLVEQGEPQYFDISAETLANKAAQLKQPNFPSMNWALRYTLDVEDTGVRIPYHEYLDLLAREGGVGEELLNEIAVTIDEPELRDGFTYVAKHIDDDQAIYLLTKIRRSLLKVKEHEVIDTSQIHAQLGRIEELIAHTWDKRGYQPGLKNLLLAIPGVRENYEIRVSELVESIDRSAEEDVKDLMAAFAGEQSALGDQFGDLLSEVQDFMYEQDLTAKNIARLASLNLTVHQFARISGKEGIRHSLREICENPYLLFENYQPGQELEASLSGEKIDGPIDLLKIDLALLPLVKYQHRVKELHDLRATDHRRLRAVVIEILRNREYSGDCFLDVDEIIEEAESYSLFYKADTPYSVDRHLKEPKEEAEKHFQEKLVMRRVDGRTFYYLKELYDDELFVRQFILDLIERSDHAKSAKALEADIPSAITALGKKIGPRFDAALFQAEREHLYSLVASKSFFVITGLPGAGKSYELLKLIEFFRSQRETHRVLSFTGKAVIRLKNNEEAIASVDAKTIDKFLTEAESTKAQAATSVIHNLIIDEASMVDLPKLAALLRNIEKKHLNRLILVGDPNQLPPIGFGKPFSDIVEMMTEDPEALGDYGVKLEVNCRAEMNDEFIGFSKIFSNESKFAEGYLAQTAHEDHICGGNVELVFWSSRKELRKKLDDKVAELLRKEGFNRAELPRFLGIDSATTKPSDLERFQVLTPYRNGYFGSSGVNLFFQDELRPKAELSEKIGEKVFKLYDKVMHTQNEYRGDELVVSNGSLGSILKGGRVFFLERDMPLKISSLRTSNALELAYAITVHKSQGSGFNHVFIVLPEKAIYSHRELLYTALTRARNQVTLLIQQGGEIPNVPSFLNKIRSRSAVIGRRTSLFSEGGERYAYMPDEGVIVKSRVEYIIYRKLLDAREKHGTFSFNYENTYDVKGQPFDIHPDFEIRFSDERVVYWEHLGLVTSKSYMSDWDKRRKIYENQQDFDKVLTTDELRGISDEKIEEIIEKMVMNDLVSEDDSDRYSKMHFSLR